MWQWVSVMIWGALSGGVSSFLLERNAFTRLYQDRFLFTMVQFSIGLSIGGAFYGLMVSIFSFGITLSFSDYDSMANGMLFFGGVIGGTLGIFCGFFCGVIYGAISRYLNQSSNLVLGLVLGSFAGWASMRLLWLLSDLHFFTDPSSLQR
jgi:fructose-specific phosphotransferase system IIC component